LSSSFQQNLFGSIPSFQFYRRFSYLLFAIYVVFVKKKEGSVLGHGTTAWVPAQVPGAWLWPQYTLRYRAGTGSGSSGRPVSLPVPGRSSPPPCHRPPPARSGCCAHAFDVSSARARVAPAVLTRTASLAQRAAAAALARPRLPRSHAVLLRVLPHAGNTPR
jgi:hypothetical protein